MTRNYYTFKCPARKERTILSGEGNNNPPVPTTLYSGAHGEVQEGEVHNAGNRDIQEAMMENSRLLYFEGVLDDDNEDQFGCDGPPVLRGKGAVHAVGRGRRVGYSIPHEGGNKDLAGVVVVVVDGTACPVNWEDMKWRSRNIVDHILEAVMVNGDAVPIVEGGEVQVGLHRKDDRPWQERDILSCQVNRTTVTKRSTLNEPIVLLVIVCRGQLPSKMRARGVVAEKICV